MPLKKRDNPVPDFIVAGASRSGTTFLCTCLILHPGIWMPRPFIPEPKVFTNPHLSREKYQEKYRKLFAKADRPILGEKTVNYLEIPGAAQRIYELLPDVKLIFLLREPVARAYSNWLWSRMNGHETLSFEEAVKREEERRHVIPPGLMTTPFDYLHRSKYDELLEPYLKIFPKQQLGIFLYEDFENNWRKVVDGVLNLISIKDVEKVSSLDWPGIINSADIGSPLSSNIQSKLRKAMAPSVNRLSKIIDLDLTPWGY